MSKIKYLLVFTLLILVSMSVLTACTSTKTTTTTTTSTTAAAQTMYIGGTFAITGAYAEDTTAVLNGFLDYAKYVNDNHIIAPWYTDRTLPSNVTVQVLWGDDQLAADKALTIYDDLKSKGLLVERVSSTAEGLALKEKMNSDRVGATSQATSPAYLSPPETIFTNAPIYTDSLAGAADWFMQNWKGTAKPRVAYLTADMASGRSIDIPEMQAYLEKAGFEFAGKQFPPLVPTTPPTTQLSWLKDNKVDLAIGFMVNGGSQPTIKEAVRLGMGTDQPYKITFAFANPSHLQIFVPAMGTTGNGVVVTGDFVAWESNVAGVQFANALNAKYRAGNPVTNIMYLDGIIEGMTQVEAQRLAMAQTGKTVSQLKPVDVLEYGYYNIKDFSDGDITITPLNYGPGQVCGVSKVRIQQVQNGKIVEVGSAPLHNIYKHE
ncbi:MAG: ABC transporter substrate-binding protein [Dehalococcoidales bacterium]